MTQQEIIDLAVTKGRPPQRDEVFATGTILVVYNNPSRDDIEAITVESHDTLDLSPHPMGGRRVGSKKLQRVIDPEPSAA